MIARAQTKVSQSSLTAALQDPAKTSSLSSSSSALSRARSGNFAVSMGPGSSSGLRRKGAAYLLEGVRAIKTLALGPEAAVVGATKASAPKKPLKAYNAYQLFQKDPALQEQLTGLPLNERSKKTSALWKELDEKQKSKYETEAELGGAFKAKKNKTKGPGKGYNLFVSQEYATIKKEGVKYNEAFKELGKRWKELSEAQKEKYNK